MFDFDTIELLAVVGALLFLSCAVGEFWYQSYKGILKK
jgi:hypothetical protein